MEVEAESLEELREALEAGADIVMLDELSLEDMREAVKLTAGRAKLKLEASGDIKDSTLRVTVFVIPRYGYPSYLDAHSRENRDRAAAIRLSLGQRES